jgi:hypothetical protein
MPRKMMRLFTAATMIVALAALLVPATAGAKGPSAVDVYVEQVQSPNGHDQSAPTSGSGGPSSSGPSSTLQLSPQAKHKLRSQGGSEAGLLRQVASQAGNARRLAAVGSVSQPGTLNAAFDLGTGPTLLFALVLATGLFVVVGGGLRGYRRWRGPRA